MTAKPTTEQVVDHWKSVFEIPDAHASDPSLSSDRCPECSNTGQWRRGAGFEGQKICMTCHRVWCPDSIDSFREIVAGELTNVGGDGI